MDRTTTIVLIVIAAAAVLFFVMDSKANAQNTQLSSTLSGLQTEINNEQASNNQILQNYSNQNNNGGGIGGIISGLGSLITLF